jgi:hypothetical protein
MEPRNLVFKVFDGQAHGGIFLELGFVNAEELVAGLAQEIAGQDTSNRSRDYVFVG